MWAQNITKELSNTGQTYVSSAAKQGVACAVVVLVRSMHTRLE